MIRLAMCGARNFFFGGRTARTSDSEIQSVAGSTRGDGAMVMDAIVLAS